MVVIPGKKEENAAGEKESGKIIFLNLSDGCTDIHCIIFP